MTKKQYNANLRKLMIQVNRLITRRANELWCSGAFDTASYGDAFLLPKAVLYALLDDAKFQVRPLSPEGREIANNLKHF